MSKHETKDHKFRIDGRHAAYIKSHRKEQERRFGLMKEAGLLPIDAQLVNSADVLLPTDIWKYIDTDLRRAMKTSALVYSTLQGRCTRFIPVGATVVSYRVAGLMDGPVRTALFSAATPEQEDRIPQKEIAHQVPITTQYWTLPFEDMEADRIANGSQIYNETRFEAMDLVARDIEKIVLDGDTLTNTTGLRGLTGDYKITHTNTLESAQGTDWRDLISTIKEVFIDKGFMLAGMDALTLFVNDKDWDRAGDREFSTQYGNMKISEYVMTMSGVGEVVPTASVKQNEVFAIVPQPKWLQFPTGLMPVTEMYPNMMSREGMKFRTQAKIGNIIGEDYNGVKGCIYAVKT